MKEFVVSDEPKAVLKMKDKEYKFRTPSSDELLAFNKRAKDKKEYESDISLMQEFLSVLGEMPKEEVGKLPAETFKSLFDYVVTPFGTDSKKN